jgi:hypothetical protein
LMFWIILAGSRMLFLEWPLKAFLYLNDAVWVVERSSSYNLPWRHTGWVEV